MLAAVATSMASTQPKDFTSREYRCTFARRSNVDSWTDQQFVLPFGKHFSTEDDMLVLTRSVDESVYIKTSDGVIQVMVCRNDGDKVRLGFNAPREIPIDREEYYERDARTRG